jgi:hypothetical protein
MSLSSLAVRTSRAADRAARGNDGLDAAKLLAIALMATNHLLLALPQPWPTVGHFAGRPCLALFAFILANRLAAGPPARAGHAARRLLIWGLVALFPYLLLVAGFALRLDVLVTLAAGAAGVWLWRTRRWAWLALLAAATALLSPWLDGGALGAAAVLAGAILIERGRLRTAAVVVAGPVCAANLITSPDRPLAALLVLSALPMLVLARLVGRRIPRAPGWIFYAFYPAHLLVIWLVFGPYG